MSRDCHACRHPEVEAINLMLLAKKPMREIAAQFGLSTSSIHRHAKHIPANLAMATMAREVASADTVMARVMELDQRADTIYTQATAENDPALALKALKELREIVGLYARLTGEISSAKTVNNTMIVALPEWTIMRAVMLRALQPFPDARQALVEALGGLDA